LPLRNLADLLRTLDGAEQAALLTAAADAAPDASAAEHFPPLVPGTPVSPERRPSRGNLGRLWGRRE
jgi:hypothetical protein